MHDLPGAYPLQLIELVGRWNVSAESLTEGLELGDLHNPGTRVDLPQMAELIQRALRMTGEPALGFHMGMQMRLSWHGFLGFAAMTAGNVRQALMLAEKFAGIRTTAFGFETHEAGASCSLLLREFVPLGPAREFVTIALFVGLVRIAQDLTGQPLSGMAYVTFTEPPYYERVAHLLPGGIRFEQPQNRLVFPSSILDLPLLSADPVATELAREQCERELSRISREAQEDPIVSRTRALMKSPERGFLAAEAVALRLKVSPRTLKRRLAEQGTSYSDLLDTLRQERAALLLEDPELSVQEIADRVGYSDNANFTRAFKRWTGLTPQAFRSR